MPTVDSSYTIKTTYLRACLLNVLRECPRRAADRPHLHHLHHSCPLAAPLFSHWLTRLAPARPSTISSLFQSTPLLIISTEPTATPRAHQLDVHSYAIQLSGQLASHHQSTQFLEPTFSVVKNSVTMAAIDMSLAASQLTKRANFASREPGVIVVFAIVGAVAILMIGLLISKRMSARKAGVV
ncbi:hypothetical protein PMIN03_002674 [Paraphaeosphaeria minitans]